MIRRHFSSSEPVKIVNAINDYVDKQPRNIMTLKKLYFRTVQVAIHNSHKQLFVQKRAKKKYVFAGYWDIAPGGVVLASESDLRAARREIKEEMGIEGDLKELGTIGIMNEGWYWWAVYYSMQWDGEVTPDPNEVEDVALMDLSEIKKRLSKGELFTPNSVKALGLISGYLNSF